MDNTRRAPLQSLFFDHPASVNETYFQHMGFALRFAGLLALAAGAALLHALVPALCERTASTIIRCLHARIEARR
ncbi:DUF6356 family protein [Thalassococcus arenae]|nr:DUF6356 family protein [Thalassococcus arenae]